MIFPIVLITIIPYSFNNLMKLFAINYNEGNAYEFFDKEDNKIHPNNKRIIVVKEKIYLF